MLAKAEQYERRREDFENLAMAYLRLAEQADRNAKSGQPLEPDDPAAHQSSRSRRYDSNSNTRPKIKPWIDG
jgi:hypothetical protein